MKITGYVTHSDCSLHDTGWGHPEHQGRLPAVARAVYRDMMTLFEPLLEIEASPASDADLLLAHTPQYIESVRAAVEIASRTSGIVDLGETTRVSAASLAAAIAAVGSGVTAADAVVDGRVRNAFCAVRPPGHRVTRDQSGGYGLFNTAAITALTLRRRHGLKSVLVLDIGARAGVGTMEILGEDVGVGVVSLHGSLDPGIGGAASPHRSIAMPGGSGGAVVMTALQTALLDLEQIMVPDAIVLSLGCDALASDATGDLSLLSADYHALTHIVVERADRWCSGRLISILEEGYDAPGMGSAVVQHLRALSGLPPAG